MTLIFYEYTAQAHSKYLYKIVVNTKDNNTVFKTNKYSDLYFFYERNHLNYYDTKTTKQISNHRGELLATQTIYYTSEGIHNGKIYT